ncbi:hypothetical protein ACP275_04G189700 [Erythranthe tilingii]
MGKHFWMKHLDSQLQDKQPGCMSGLVHVLDYHLWRSNVRKMIRHRKYDEGRETHDHKYCDAEQRLEEIETPYLRGKRPRANKKRSLKSRLKRFITDEESQGVAFKSKNLERTYSIHHLESLDKLRSDWKHPIIFFPRNVENRGDEIQTKAAASEEGTEDVLEIFKVDKELLIKHLDHSDKAVINFSRSALGLNTEESKKFGKSRSFPVAELSRGIKMLKPMTLESKQREVWSNRAPLLNGVLGEKEITIEPKNAMDEKLDENVRKNSHSRSSSLNESLDKYARLFENSFPADAMLNASKSLRLTNEYAHAPVYFQRIRSASLVDSYYSNSNFEVFGEDSSGNDSVVTVKDSENLSCLQETECHAAQFPICEGSENESNIQTRQPLEKDETIECPKKKKNYNSPDSYYARQLLDTSGIEVDPTEMTWHSSDQPLGPQLFEQVETRWPQEQEELNGLPDFNGCWHHKMVFDLVNEVLIELYDVSLPYYPKALSSSCYVRPFPLRDRIVDDVIKTVGSFLNLKPDEMESYDLIVGRDFGRDRMWMNLQVETECVALDIEDMIFDEMLDDVIFS